MRKSVVETNVEECALKRLWSNVHEECSRGKCGGMYLRRMWRNVSEENVEECI